MSEDRIKGLREAIDNIDDKLLALIKERLDLTGEIGEIKKENRMKIIDMSREKALFQSLEKKCQELHLDVDIVTNIWQQILKASYRSQEL